MNFTLVYRFRDGVVPIDPETGAVLEQQPTTVSASSGRVAALLPIATC